MRWVSRGCLHQRRGLGLGPVLEWLGWAVVEPEPLDSIARFRECRNQPIGAVVVALAVLIRRVDRNLEPDSFIWILDLGWARTPPFISTS